MTRRARILRASADPVIVSAVTTIRRSVCAAALCGGLMAGQAGLVFGADDPAADPGQPPATAAPAEPPAPPEPQPPPEPPAPPPEPPAPPTPAASVPSIFRGDKPTQAWPAQTSVSFTIGSSTYGCAGTLVSARWVLTAAHCASDRTGAIVAPRAYVVRVGGRSRARDGRATAVDRVVRHPGYRIDSVRSDVALLHLATAVAQAPLRMIGTGAAERALWDAGTQATIVGWGATERSDRSDRLIEARTPILSDSRCASAWRARFHEATMLCAGGTGPDTCEGDSGGPLMVRRSGAFVVAGVTSWGPACGRGSRPSVYARLGAPAINAWVRRIIPTASFRISSAAPAISERVHFSATIGPSLGIPRLSWDTDGDGAFDDASGPTASTAFTRAGPHAVRLQSRYPDGDRAVVREVVDVRG